MKSLWISLSILCFNVKLIMSQITLLNVAITSTNRGTQTDFVARTTFGGTINLNNVWLGIGLNSQSAMVYIFKRIKVYGFNRFFSNFECFKFISKIKLKPEPTYCPLLNVVVDEFILTKGWRKCGNMQEFRRINVCATLLQ